MQRGYVLVLVGMVLVTACVDRKTKSSIDGAARQDALVGEVPAVSGTGGSSGSDGAIGPDLRQPGDTTTVSDMPIVLPDGSLGGAGGGGGGTLGTGGRAGSGAGGSISAGAGGSVVTGSGGVVAGTGGTVEHGTGGSVITGTGGSPGMGGATAPPALLANGSPCTGGTICASGVCADGVCCNNPCSGCNACTRAATGQADGLCAPVSAGADPHSTCNDETASNQCGNDGSCDGNGACRKVGTSHQCAAAGCQGSTFTPASYCNGTGACTAVTAQNCGTFQCSVTDGCKTTCTTQADCGTQSYCNTSTGSCLAKVATGAACTQALACQSGNCVDGVCCESTCTGSCKACSAAKTGASDGLCRGVKVGTDPDSECGIDTSNACGLDGMCDGVGACRYQVTGTPCGSASCTGQRTYTTRGQCNGSGTCLAGSTDNCPNNLLCASTSACATTCTDLSTTGCPSGFRCAGGNSCVAAYVPCGLGGATSCSIANGAGCVYTDANTVCGLAEPQGFIPCNSRTECPSGQYCCINGGNICHRTEWDVACRTDTSKCVGGGMTFGYHLCDPTLNSADCPSGTTCQALNSCLAGIYGCQ